MEHFEEVNNSPKSLLPKLKGDDSIVLQNCFLYRVGQNRICTLYMTVCMLISLLSIPYIHLVYIFMHGFGQPYSYKTVHPINFLATAFFCVRRSRLQDAHILSTTFAPSHKSSPESPHISQPLLSHILKLLPSHSSQSSHSQTCCPHTFHNPCPSTFSDRLPSHISQPLPSHHSKPTALTHTVDRHLQPSPSPEESSAKRTPFPAGGGPTHASGADVMGWRMGCGALGLSAGGRVVVLGSGVVLMGWRRMSGAPELSATINSALVLHHCA